MSRRQTGRSLPVVFYPIKEEQAQHLLWCPYDCRGLLVFRIFQELPTFERMKTWRKREQQARKTTKTIQYPRHWRMVTNALRDWHVLVVLARVLQTADGLELLYYYRQQMQAWRPEQIMEWLLACEALTLAGVVPIQGPCPTTPPKPYTTRGTSP